MQVLRALRTATLLLAFIVGAVMTFGGLLAPVSLVLELPNHARPFTLLGSLLMFALCWLLKDHGLGKAFAGLSLINIALFAAPLMFSASSGSTDPGTQLKLVSFNKQYENASYEDIADFLNEADPDVAVFQEMYAFQAEKLYALLKAKFPHQHYCPKGSGCLNGIVARHPLGATGLQPGTDSVTPQAWAEITLPNAKPLRIVSLHVAYPVMAKIQARHIDALIEQYRGHAQPLIIAGDFNLTPWSWQLNKLAWQTSLRRHGTWSVSWPNQQGLLSKPFVLIDNVLTTPDIRAVSFRSGPSLGSDHRAVIATMQLP